MGAASDEEPLRGLQRLQLGYVLALALIGAFTLSGQSVIQGALRSQLRSAEVINVAGRQRMLSQRVAKHGLLLAEASTTAEFAMFRSNLEEDLDTWDRTHARLLHGDLASSVEESSSGAEMLAEVDETQAALSQSAHRMTTLDWADRDRVAPLVAEVLELEEVYLPGMNDVVFELSRAAETSVAQTRRTEYALAGGTLLLLVAEAFLIFGPLLRRIRSSVSAREAMATRLARSEARFARAVEGTNEGLWDWNIDSGELHWSRRFCEIAGLDPHAPPVWADIEQRIVRADRDRLNALLGRRETLPETIDVEFRLERGDGPFWVRLEGATTNSTHLSGSLTEIDEQRRIAAERERLLRNREAALQDTREDLMRTQLMNAVGSLAGGIAHDFNNYLLVIQLSAQLLRDESNADLLAPLLQATEDASNLAQQLLALRRSGGDELLIPVSLEDALKTFDPMLQRLLPDSIALTIDIEPALPNVLADKSQLRQVLVNLCLNARDAMPKGGQLKIRARALTSRRSADGPREGVELTVEDDGVGMDTDVHSRALEPFFTTKDMGKGTGLGLAMVEAIVRRHDGWIAIESAIDNGTVVRVWLPSATEAPNSGSGPTAGAAVAVRQLSVLLVDDQAQIRNLGTRVLERAGHKVVAVGDGESAIATANDPANAFDVVVCDVVLPGLHGPEVADRIRMDLGWDIPILLMSGYSEARLEIDGPRIDFIQKPFGAEALRQRIWKLVETVTADESQPKGRDDSGALR